MQAQSNFIELTSFCPLNQRDLECWVSETPPIQGAQGDTSNHPRNSQIAPTRGQYGGAEEQLSAARAKLDELRKKGKSELKQVWLDEPYWRELAKLCKFRMPAFYSPLSPRGIERVLRSLSLGRDFFRSNFGLKTYAEFVDRNPAMPLWAFAGLCLELIDLEGAIVRDTQN